ncbi:HK97 family phage prohead protease [Undibacterium curvum]|uniref:HK97 family phage prohead protease n=1 Tax=Undibacterium curvum TaxID=2762294 RepID=UPI003D0F3BE2
MKHKNNVIQHKQFAFKTDSVNEDGTFSGYGSVFGNVDSYGEIVAPGAFKESIAAIKASGDPLPALWQHRWAEPIGGYDLLEEDERGLKVEGWLLTGQIPRAAEAHALMKHRVVKGLSIGYYVLEDSWNEKDRIRTLTKLDLQEISIVTFPANVEAQVESVKSILAQGNLPTLSQFEDFLRESGYSKSQATIIASKGLKELLSRSESGGKKSDALTALRNFQLSK